MIQKSCRNETKCVSIQMPIEWIQRLDDLKHTTGLSKSALLLNFIEAGLNIQK